MNIGQDMILVTGATGQQGGATLRELLQHGHCVRAMTRNPDSEKAQALASRGAEVVKGDLNDAASVRAALDGAWGAFAVQNTWEAGVDEEEQQGKRFAELALASGLRHLVYASVASADRETGIPHFDNKARVEAKIGNVGLPSYTIVRPVFFMENFLSPWFKPGIDQGQLQVGIKPQTELQMIGVDDIGRYGRLAFERHADLNGRAVDIAGDELTMLEAAEVLANATGHPVAFEPTPIEEVRKFSEDFAIMLEWFDREGFSADIAGNAEKYGVTPTPFETWAAGQVWN